MLEVSELNIYPIKSFNAVAVNAMQMDSLGAKYDRRYMLVDGAGAFISQRRFSHLCLADISDDGDSWLVSLPNLGAKNLAKIGSTDSLMKVQIWSDKLSVFDQGDSWAFWFSQFLGEAVRLVYIDETVQRLIDRDFTQHARLCSFVDGFPLLVCQQSSLVAINERLKKAVTMQRFRANIVISGGCSFAEDDWQCLSISEQVLDIVKPCSRCVIPTINPNTGQKEKELWQVLSKLRKAADGNVYFGQNAIHGNIQSIHLGDEVAVLKP